MRSPRSRPLLIVLAGICSGVAVALISGSAARVSASNRYEDLGLFTSVLELVRSEYVEEVDERTPPVTTIVLVTFSGLPLKKWFTSHELYKIPIPHSTFGLDSYRFYAGVNYNLPSRLRVSLMWQTHWFGRYYSERL